MVGVSAVMIVMFFCRLGIHDVP